MKAELLIRERFVFPDGSLAEMVVWRVPEPVPPTIHGFKYSLVYVIAGERVVGFDNERGKGDHRHLRDRELPYAFVSVDRLLDDFVAAVDEVRSKG
jgi:hypothetical protein